MDKAKWADLVEDNERQTLTLTLDQRNTLAAAAAYIEDLEQAQQGLIDRIIDRLFADGVLDWQAASHYRALFNAG